MTTGHSGTYAFNNVDFQLPPTEGKWVERTSYGVDGGGHPIYSNFRHFELSWELSSPSDLYQVINIYNSVSNTGTVVACLPQWGNQDYVFYNYSGTTMQEPEVGPYFAGFTQSVKLLLLNIRTN